MISKDLNIVARAYEAKNKEVEKLAQENNELKSKFIELQTQFNNLEITIKQNKDNYNQQTTIKENIIRKLILDIADAKKENIKLLQKYESPISVQKEQSKETFEKDHMDNNYFPGLEQLTENQNKLKIELKAKEQLLLYLQKRDDKLKSQNIRINDLIKRFQMKLNSS